MPDVALSAAQTVSILSAEPGRRFYHSCQLRDFESYLRAGAVLCRDDLAALGRQAGTPFETDALNRRRGVLRHIFGNLSDQAWAYRFLLGVPDIYGPIQLEFDLAALEEFPGLTARRNGISAADPSVVDSEGALRDLYHSELPDRLRGDFRGEIEGHAAELSFVRLRRILVMPLAHAGTTLPTVVRALAEKALGTSRGVPDVLAREIADEHLAKLVNWAHESSQERWEHDSLPPFVSFWLREVTEHHNVRGQPFDCAVFLAKLRRFARCLEHGTLSRMRGQDGGLAFNL